LKNKFGGGKILTRIAIHILVKKGELLIWRKNGHFPHCGVAGKRKNITSDFIFLGRKITYIS
jgi:hypothetical protein